ncbi:hypothetical protein QBC47DRAFT_31794 [Echria macrotheca]|uniref:Uncharacterized protein n=1 Tax=Echria macrotheca TaxID=438768 RepID=A0AAJ0BBU6_9PEZI|nr:hypothetical protein QBC47DRAFT_31794 [Echria macrotheca]
MQVFFPSPWHLETREREPWEPPSTPPPRTRLAALPKCRSGLAAQPRSTDRFATQTPAGWTGSDWRGRRLTPSICPIATRAPSRIEFTPLVLVACDAPCDLPAPGSRPIASGERSKRKKQATVCPAGRMRLIAPDSINVAVDVQRIGPRPAGQPQSAIRPSVHLPFLAAGPASDSAGIHTVLAPRTATPSTCRQLRPHGWCTRSLTLSLLSPKILPQSHLIMATAGCQTGVAQLGKCNPRHPYMPRQIYASHHLMKSSRSSIALPEWRQLNSPRGGFLVPI